jgi:hypothetical protein
VPRLRLASLSLLVVACATAEPELVETAGPCAEAFGGQTCTWSLAQNDSLLQVGATVALASITGAPDSMPMAWPPAYQADLSMPAGSEASGIVNYTFAWEPMGHGPLTYLTPHFDFHFNLIPASERQAIDCSDRTKPAALATGYVLPDEALPPEVAAMIGVDTLIGVCVPNMGMHSIPEADVSATEPFHGAIVVGYYGGRPTFIEPMVSRAKLLERQSFDLSVPEIPGLDRSYPRSFRAEWVPATESYRFTFADFR